FRLSSKLPTIVRLSLQGEVSRLNSSTASEFDFIEIDAGRKVLSIFALTIEHTVRIVVVVHFKHQVTPSIVDRDAVGAGICEQVDILQVEEVVLSIAVR